MHCTVQDLKYVPEASIIGYSGPGADWLYVSYLSDATSTMLQLQNVSTGPY